MIWINKGASALEIGQRVKVRTTHRCLKGTWICTADAASTCDGYSVVKRGKKVWRLSPSYPVQIPLEEDPILGGAAAS